MACVDRLTDSSNCGVCGRACGQGHACVNGECAAQGIEALHGVRPIEPMPGARLGNGAVVFRWSPRGARVQVCGDRACARVLHTLTSPVPEVRVPAPLAPGVYFWRLQTMNGVASSPTVWSFRVDARRATRVGLLPPDLDTNGDGLADVVALTERGRALAVYLGSRAELSDAPDLTVPLLTLGANSLVLALGGDDAGSGLRDVFVRYDGVTRARVIEYESRFLEGAVRLSVFDIDYDGLTDRVGWSAPGDLRLWLGSGISNGDGLPVRREAATARVAVAVVGDVNGDDYSDVLLGVPTSDPPRAWVYFGSSLGLDRSQLLPPPPRGAGFGESLASAGDVNGDGRADLLVRSNLQGAAVYLGGSPVTLHRWLGGTGVGDFLVSRAGDVNGDGYGDVLGVPVGRSEGWLYYGSAAGLATTPVVLSGSAWVGCTQLTGAPGDVNGDGFDDVLVGAPSAGEVRVLYGAATAPFARVAVRRGAPSAPLAGGVL